MLSFPEFSAQGFKPPAGGAIIFSCSLLHAASVMRRGMRHGYLRFLYVDAVAKILEANRSLGLTA